MIALDGEQRTGDDALVCRLQPATHIHASNDPGPDSATPPRRGRAHGPAEPRPRAAAHHRRRRMPEAALPAPSVCPRRAPASRPSISTAAASGAPRRLSPRWKPWRAEAHEAGLGDLYVEDISHPRGGPLPGGHVAHQIGLDVDIGLDPGPKPPLTPQTRETVELPSMVSADLRSVDPAHWSPGVVTLLHLAANLPGVDRILVNAAIKRQLCNTVQGDRAWLRLIRPLVRPRGAYAYPLPLPRGPAVLRGHPAATGRRRLRRHAAMVVRPAQRPTEALGAVPPAAATRRLRRGLRRPVAMTASP